MNEVLIVTGGSRGIGAATARIAGRSGYAVCVNFLKNKAAAKQIVDKINADGGHAIAVGADISKEEEVLELFSTVDDSLGKISALVNNAGILESQMRIEDMDEKRLNRVFLTNITGSILCAREAVKRMSIKNGGNGGTIVNLSSAAARLGSPGEYIDYAASKGAIDTFTRGLAQEVAEDGIRVNAVRPGVIETDIHASGGEPGRVERIKDTIPLKRGGQPEEVAKAIMWLLSSDSSYTTGSLLEVSGGR
ncbi:MAG: SDR family oxidoreductase [SAR324 cluster bacterium]|nr:SDR family oxidoreductase [SAR324 cluster bacterium]MED5515637.1 SDR family oxidoreductase [SAR324 cluster bacterium]MED6340660.1 SDR family oxidoreductase [SAR324 cluster bacterium]MEE2599726.1 SDR family oxidoreductase [SAR324 cluster bacterium]